MALLARTDQQASTRRDPRLSHNCDCFDRFCWQVLPTKRIELAATSVVASLCGQRSGASLPPLDEKRTDGIQRLR
jgi:hypothetical protein